MCHFRESTPTKQEPNSKLPCFEEKIMKKYYTSYTRKLKEESKRPALYKRKM